MLEIHLHLINLETYENVVYLRMKYKDWSTKRDIHFEYKWRNANAMSLLINYKL